jgi:3-hydroxyisobutyrate dehydrogenase-like beta-hydroxyacid dehydrogenase
MVWMNTPREVAAAAGVTFSMVTDDNALKDLSEGPDGILAALRPGKLYVDMSAVSREASVELSGRVRELGAAMLDAPLLGSVPQAEAGTLVIMVGGDFEAFAMALPLLRELGQTVTYISPNGQALLLKLAINLSLAAQILAFSEGLLPAERGGIDRHLAAAVMGQLDRVADAQGSHPADARPGRGWMVRHRTDAQGHRSRSRSSGRVRGSAGLGGARA